MYRASPHRWKLWSILLLPQLLQCAVAIDATPRWGQATVLVYDALFIYGGKTDEFNSYSYTQAPNTNDILYLSLSSPFTGESPRWELVSGSSNTSTSQGPALAWHTLSAFNNTDVLLFGGQPDANSPIVITDRNDSAALLDVFSRLGPTWSSEPSSWGGEPIRRIRHSTATSPDGLVFIFGGEKADGSQNALSDHYYFDPKSLTFNPLPSTNAPPGLYGHVSIMLPDGRILVFGGYCQSRGELLSLGTIWVLESKTLAWSVITVDSANLPSPRMSFAAVLISGERIIIHGGSDANLQNNFEDGWVLDTTTLTWTRIDALSLLGPRRDHCAVFYGGQVIFGFGYTNSGPAPAPLQIFDPSSNVFIPSYTPPPATSTPTQTFPLPTQTPKPNTPTSPPKPTNGGVQPTSTVGVPPDNNGSNGSNGSNDDDDSGSSSSTTAIAVSTAFGVLGLIVVGLGVAYYVRRQHRAKEGERRFIALGEYDDDDRGSPHLHERIPIANMSEINSPPPAHHGILATLGLVGAATRLRAVSNPQQRRDMLADEDTQSFGEWYNARRREGTAGSSWSLRSILGGLRSREVSTTGQGPSNLPTPWREKADPFSDGASLIRDEETGFIGAAMGASTRPHGQREASFTSSKSGRSYRDPFSDPIEEERRIFDEAAEPYRDQDQTSDDELDPSRPSIRAVPTLPPLKTVLPLSQQAGHPLSPLSEHTSQSTLPLQTFSTSGSSHAHSSENSPFPGGSLSRATSLTSMEPTPLPPRSPPPKTSSIIGAGLLGSSQPMRRSNSWWSRFSRTSLLDRRSSVVSRAGYEIRDPNPPPKLVAIEERSVVSSPTPDKNSPGTGSPGSAEVGAGKKMSPQQAALLSRANSGRLFGTGHGKSMTSLRTADSEAIERMAGQMDVVQRVTTRSQRGTGSISSTGGHSIDTHESASELGVGEAQREREGSRDSWHGQDENLIFFTSPVEDTHQSKGSLVDPSSHPLAPSESTPHPPQLNSPPPSAWPASKARTGSTTPPGSDNSPHSSPSVASRVRAFERRMSQEAPVSPPPTNTKHREERTKKRVQVDYGLVKRPNLFVANPDHRSSTYSAESS
ncbi:unnamed protein product [Cyclocybe aegerita]|uniref:Galactose oxidase n=1 Tax=Cyclocybe aegerita TaxID=1973307 RepID=A0A8S0WVS1_CYCAE|nr:unnamed protein product [Cyclocybe aegerita]